ncbi:spore germination protein [Schinkia azotoformans]|uniref:Spore germination protein PF n=1 Tax=Schinkia azotoformans LMG 9581 TaxID=1131731 RepID=K6BWI5_SCHAZ|nr:spore germination protein [Schinkia azotoformans]EKN63300.1 spore germination protein PF [Schinkia azotoformans LMG 9581]MEC1640382.1 spore germination protein [Schinkia azotoformans]MEC1719341.1 spore germination protein [Schinkia azotoformans]MEC1946566.1 spore germination protein [Schinkia azotoformans]MED4353409.1 spore germination protein [Schinkia azotoformans]
MPSVIGGPINIGTASGVVHFGDSFYISPKNVSKLYSGSGGSNTGNLNVTNNGVSATNTFDPDAADQPNAQNG